MSQLISSELVSPCGLYCGCCHKYKKGKCPGCAENEKATWCKLRTCVSEKGVETCADCLEFTDVDQCKKFNNIFSKFFAFVFKSDRKASLQRIDEIGVQKYAEEMAAKGTSVLKKG